MERQLEEGIEMLKAKQNIKVRDRREYEREIAKKRKTKKERAKKENGSNIRIA